MAWLEPVITKLSYGQFTGRKDRKVPDILLAGALIRECLEACLLHTWYLSHFLSLRDNFNPLNHKTYSTSFRVPGGIA